MLVVGKRREGVHPVGVQLEGIFEVNENEIPELQETLRSRLGTLGELFGVVRQVAGDTRGFLESSIVSAELPGRAQALDKLAESKDLPTVEELEGQRNAAYVSTRRAVSKDYLHWVAQSSNSS